MTGDDRIIALTRARTDSERCRAAAQLKSYIATELLEEGTERYNNFIDDLNHRIVTWSNSSDSNDNKTGVLAIVALIEADSKSSSQPTRYIKSLNTINQYCADWSTLRLSTWALGRFARSEGNVYDRCIEPVMSKAFELLDERVKVRESNDNRKMAAILTIRELAINAPTFLFQKLDRFFKLILIVLKDHKKEIRFAAIAALRASLTLVAQREPNFLDSEHMSYECDKYYERLLDGAKSMLDKDEEIKGGIMIIIEMLRCASTRDELLQYEQNCDGGSEELSLLKIIGVSSLHEENRLLISNNIEEDNKMTDVLGEEGHNYSKQCAKIIYRNFVQIGDLILRHKGTKSVETQFLLTEVLPRLAAFNHEIFQEHFLSDTFAYLTTLAKAGMRNSSGGPPTVFLAIGQIAYSMKDRIVCYMENIFTVIKPYIPLSKETNRYRKTPNPVVESNVLQLISLLAKATKSKFYSSISEYLDSMLAMNLSKSLTSCLAVLYENVPDTRAKIQDGLLGIFYKILVGAPNTKDSKQYPLDYVEPTDVDSVLLTIKTIGEFKFDDTKLKSFITVLANEYLSHPHDDIRREAAKTCARKLVPCANASGSAIPFTKHRVYPPQPMLTGVLTKLLTVVIADPKPEIRLATLKEFNKDFYKPLALSENIQSLFLAMHDECQEVREVVLELLGHLSDENPAYILPFLRQQLSQLLHQFEHTGIARNKEKSAKLLHILIRTAQPTLAKLYLKPIMSKLLPKLMSSDCTATLYRHILSCISQLAEVDGQTMKRYNDELFPFLIQKIGIVKDREASLKAMYYLVRHTGYVVTPYQIYPGLLDILLDIIQSDQSASTRTECLRLLGQLGALNPYKNKKLDNHELRNFPITQPVPEEDVTFNTGLTSELLIQKQSDKEFDLDHQYYPCVVIHALMSILEDKSQTEIHSKVIQIIVTVFQRLGGTDKVNYLPKIMPTFLNNVRTCDPKDLYFNRLADLTKNVGVHIKPYAEDIIRLIKEYWSSDGMFQNTIMMVVESLINALGGEFKKYIAQLIPLMMKVLNEDHTPNKEATKRLLSQLQLFSATLDSYLHILLPQIVAIIGNTNNSPDIRKIAVVTIYKISEYADYSDHASLMIHTLVRALSNANDMEFKMEIMNAILAIAKQMGYRFKIFKDLVVKVVRANKLTLPEFESFHLRLQSREHVLPIVPTLKVPKRSKVVEAEYSKIKLGAEMVNTLEGVWTIKNLYSEDLILWIRQLQIEFPKYTSNSSLRACSLLIQDCPTLADDLFNAVFVSLWSEQLTEAQQDKLNENLRKALEYQSITEVTMTILNLAEFMEHWGKGELDIENQVFARAARRCNAYAKALYYVEKSFLANESGTLAELLRINNTLQQHQAACGVLEYAKHHRNTDKPQDSWYEELQRWEEALQRYNKNLNQNQCDKENNVLGRLRCLEALNRWEDMEATVTEHWQHFNSDSISTMGSDHHPRSQMASLAASASWRLAKWDKLDDYIGEMQMSYHKHFYSAVSAIVNQKYDRAQEYIDQSRETLSQEIAVIVKEGYHRFYKKMIDMHMLSEIEEVLDFKRSFDSNIVNVNCREFRNVPDKPRKEEQKSRLRKIWWERLQGCQRTVEDWSKILEVHKLVLQPKEDEKAWLKFSSIARKSQRYDLAHRILINLIGENPEESDNWLENNSTTQPAVVYQYLKYQWNVATTDDSRRRTYHHLSSYINNHYQACGDNYMVSASSYNQGTWTMLPEQKKWFPNRLKSKYKLKQGLWKIQLLREEGHVNPVEPCLKFFAEAKNHDMEWYKAWREWAIMNKLAAQIDSLKSIEAQYEKVVKDIRQVSPQDAADSDYDDEDDDLLADSDDDDIIKTEEILQRDEILSETPPTQPSQGDDISGDSSLSDVEQLMKRKQDLKMELDRRYAMITASVSGFIKSITLSLEQNSLQDILQLLTLWFNHGHYPNVNKVLTDGIARIPFKIWIQVIPQLIARIDIKHDSVRELIHRVLNDVGREHPQALIYPLSVASKSGSEKSSRKLYACKLLEQMKEHKKELVAEGTMLSHELIRIAILWNELWHNALETASTKWFQDQDAQGMFAVLTPLYEMLNMEPETELEQSFKNTYGLDLQEAKVWCDRYQTSQNERHIKQAWEHYYNVYRRIGTTINQRNALRLEDCSPKLLNRANRMELAVPGSYDPDQPVITIASIDPSVFVIKSKQHPRKLSMKGSDGKKYTFLLKGNEDLRQDERAMQLFGLVNSLLANSDITSELNLSIQRYSIIPLSPNSGLCGWRPHSDTLHMLIKEHRDRKSIAHTLENKLSNKFCSCYEKLPLMMKIEVFEEVLNITTGEDLALIIYQRSPSAEVWFERRKNYILSHAVMSMVGYILGLGDRHPSNIMMDRKTGNLIHVDFGECFDVARDREKYPEKVPFRLTRMMRKAMEVTGIHGTYTNTCYSVMDVLRRNEASILAVLETFVYDPLINWRLMDQNSDHEEGSGQSYDMTLNKKAVEILKKVSKKLTGYDDITDEKHVCVEDQVQSLISQATASENLCQLYMGWCPFW